MPSRILENRPLFRECLEALQTTLLPKEESDRLELLFESLFPITRWGKIDWDKINQKIDIGCDPQNIIPALKQLLKTEPVDKEVYIEWSTGGVPAIKTNLDAIINHFNDVTCVAFEKFIFNPYVAYIIEILPSGQITAGLVKPIKQGDLEKIDMQSNTQNND